MVEEIMDTYERYTNLCDGVFMWEENAEDKACA